MKRKGGKSAFFITAALILALAFTSFFGVSVYYGDTKQVYIKGIEDMRWGIDISGGVEVTFVPSDDVSIDDVTDEQLDGAALVITNRLVGKNITDSEVVTDYNDKQIIVRFPWASGEEDFDPVAAVEEIGKTAQLTFCNGEDPEDVILDGSYISSAEAIAYQDEASGAIQYGVSFTLNDEGRELFAEASQTAYQNNGIISIWLDGEEISAPTVNEPITAGEGVISGDFTADSANTLANQINSGSLPFTLETDDSRMQIISPTMGETALGSMGIAAIIAFILCAIYLIYMYKLPGVVASIALLGQAGLLIATTTGYFGFADSFTMTMPGIAGLILSIGMGADANVITAERIKDELTLGKTLDGAIVAGFKNAFSAIFDGNITVLIVAFILMGAFGPTGSFLSKVLSPLMFMFSSSISGSIYSFGYTLFIGVICNFVMGIFASRLMLKGLSKFKCFRKPSLFGYRGDAK